MKKRSASKALYTSKYMKRARYNPTMSKAVKAPLGQKFKSVLRYAEELVLDGGVAGAAATYQWVVNGLYDPNYTGVGHQPMSFDQIMALYERYCVYGCKYEIEVASIDQAEQVDVIVGVCIGNSTSTSTDYTQYLENPETQWGVVECLKATKSTKRFTGYIDIASIAGTNKSKLFAEDTYFGDNTSNPGHPVMLKLFVAGLNGGNPDKIVGAIRLTFYTQFEQYKFSAQS